MKKILKQKKKYTNNIETKYKFSEKVDLEDFQKLEIRLIKLEKIVFEKI
jgi:hypothetical protein